MISDGTQIHRLILLVWVEMEAPSSKVVLLLYLGAERNKKQKRELGTCFVLTEGFLACLWKILKYCVREARFNFCCSSAPSCICCYGSVNWKWCFTHIPSGCGSWHGVCNVLDFSIYDKTIHAWHHLYHLRRLDHERIHVLLTDLEVIRHLYFFHLDNVLRLTCMYTVMQLDVVWLLNEITWIGGLSVTEVCALIDRHMNEHHRIVLFIISAEIELSGKSFEIFLHCPPTSVDWKLQDRSNECW